MYLPDYDFFLLKRGFFEHRFFIISMSIHIHEAGDEIALHFYMLRQYVRALA